jgi:DNA primase
VKHVEDHDTTFDAEMSILARFGTYTPATDEPLTLEFGDVEEETFVEALPNDWVDNSTWLSDVRGIAIETQNRFDAGYAVMRDAVGMPWMDEHGRIVTVKYRRAGDKAFWYEPRIEGGRLKSMLYGFHLAKSSKLIVVCEGEIDAMSVVQSGYAAVALGGANFSDQQASLLRNSIADEIVVFTDNDEAGRRVRKAIIDKLVGHKRVSVVDWAFAGHWKDANDVLLGHGEGYLRMMIENRVPVGLLLDI